MMKRKRYAQIVLIFVFIMSVFLCGYSSPSGVIVDDGELFSEEEMKMLNDTAQQLSTKLNAQVTILSLTEDYGSSIEAFAEKYYDDNGFGDDEGGVMLLISFPQNQARSYCVFHDRGYISNKEVGKISKEIKPYLADEDYYRAAQKYLENVDRYASARLSGGGEGDNFLKSVWVRLLIATGVSGIVVMIIIAVRNHDSKPAGQTYLGSKGVKINRQSDQFTHTTVITRKIEKEHHGGGGGNTNDRGGAGGTF